MTKEEVFAKVKEILVEEFELEPDAIEPNTLIFEDLGLDSIDAVDIIVKLKPLVEGKIEPSMFKKVKTPQDVVEVIFPLLKS